MKPVLLGMTPLIEILIKGRSPTGIKRVTIAYLKHYKDNLRGIVQLNLGFWQYNLILSQQATWQVMEFIDTRPK